MYDHHPVFSWLAAAQKSRHSSAVWRQQAIHVYLPPCSHIHMTVHCRRNIEAKGRAGSVTAGILLAIVELMGDICGVVGVESCGLVACVPGFGAQYPHNPIFESVRGYSWGCRYPWEATGRFGQEPGVVHFELTERVAVAEHVDVMVPIRHRSENTS